MHGSVRRTLSAGRFSSLTSLALDPFPDPSSLASPVTLKRNDRNRTLALSDVHVFGQRLTNEFRAGYFSLNNTRVLDDPFLAITNESVGIPNPAPFFDQGPGTQRLGHYVGRPGTMMERFSFGGPNDTFNRREQKSYSFADNVSYVFGRHFLRLGTEFKRHGFNSALPEEQATEFEKYDNFTQILRGVATEADTQFGITEKRFQFRDWSAFVADDFKINSKLTLNLGMRWEWFGWPEEKNGYIGNFDPALIKNFDNPSRRISYPRQCTENRLCSDRYRSRSNCQGQQQAHAERAGSEQLRAAVRLCLFAAGQRSLGGSRRIRRLL